LPKPGVMFVEYGGGAADGRESPVEPKTGGVSVLAFPYSTSRNVHGLLGAAKLRAAPLLIAAAELADVASLWSQLASSWSGPTLRAMASSFLVRYRTYNSIQKTPQKKTRRWPDYLFPFMSGMETLPSVSTLSL